MVALLLHHSIWPKDTLQTKLHKPRNIHVEVHKNSNVMMVPSFILDRQVDHKQDVKIYIRVFTHLVVKSGFAENIFNSIHAYTNMETKVEIVHISPKTKH